MGEFHTSVPMKRVSFNQMEAFRLLRGRLAEVCPGTSTTSEGLISVIVDDVLSNCVRLMPLPPPTSALDGDMGLICDSTASPELQQSTISYLPPLTMYPGTKTAG
jgi:hypothetical protein